MKECRPGLVRPGRRFFVCASWLISAVGPSIAATCKCFVFRIVIARGEQGHCVWRIVCNFRNKYPATCCSAFRIRGGVLCNTKTRVMSSWQLERSFVWTRQQVFMVHLLTGFLNAQLTWIPAFSSLSPVKPFLVVRRPMFPANTLLNFLKILKQRWMVCLSKQILIAKETKNLCEASSCGIGLWRDIHREHRWSGFWLQALLQRTVKWRQ